MRHAARGGERLWEQPYDRRDCPYCDAPLDPLPRAKKRCPACRQPIYVRSGPDGLRYLLRASDLEAHQARWDSYVATRAAVESAHDAAEASKFGRATLRRLREIGIATVVVIGAADPCRACAVVSGLWPIDEAPPLPVDGCANATCRCDYLPIVT